MGCVEVLCVITALFCSDLGMDDEGDDDPVPLPNVNAAILKKVSLGVSDDFSKQMALWGGQIDGGRT